MPRDMLSPVAPTLEGLIEWLKTQDSDEQYDYLDNGRCLVAQFVQHLGYPVVSVDPTHLVLQDGSKEVLPRELNYVALMTWERTFGAALKRAQALTAMNAEDRTLEMGVCL